MPSFIILLVLAGAMHVFLHLPLLLAAIAMLLLWLLWKLKWVILGIIGLDMLFGGAGADNSGGFDV